jgi:CHAT domain-containing protein/Tfp pilus assembly protein PilF
MNYLKLLCLIVAASVALACGFATPSIAQSSQADEKSAEGLDREVLALVGAGKFAGAVPLAQKALAMREQALGPDHPDVAAALIHLGGLHGLQNRYADAEAEFKRALTIYEKSFGVDDPAVAVPLGFLVSHYQQQGRYSEAEPLAERALSINQKMLGPDDPQVAVALNNLAAIYQAHDRFAEAEQMYQRALKINEKTLGPDHLTVATTLDSLAGLYKVLDRLVDAERMYQRALAIQQKTFGSDDPRVAMALSSLANLYTADGRYDEARSLQDRLLVIYERAFGPDHPMVAVALATMANQLVTQAHYSEAEPLFQRALAIGEKAGPDNPSLTGTLKGLAGLYFFQARYTEAEPLYKRVLAITEKTFGAEHSSVAEAVTALALSNQQLGRYTQAEPLLKRALTISEKAFGPDHSNVATAATGLALLYVTQGRLGEAEPLYRRAHAITEKQFGFDHPSVSVPLEGLAGLYQVQERYADAEPLLKRVRAIQEKRFGQRHPVVAVAINNLAQIYSSQRRYADAGQLNEEALAIDMEAFGPDHPVIATMLSNIGRLYQDQARYAEAELCYLRALAIDQESLGPEHPDVAIVRRNLGGLYHSQGRFADAEPLYKQSLAIREKAFGPDHPDVAASLNDLASLYRDQHRYGEALPIVRRTISEKHALTWVALPVLYNAKANKLIAAGAAFEESLGVVQRALQTSAGEALNAFAVRFSASNSRLAEQVRKDQDLAVAAASLDKAIIAAVSKEPPQRDTAAEQSIKDRISAIARERADVGAIFAHDFPDYAALSRPAPLAVKDIQRLLAKDEALVVVYLGVESYVWAISRSGADWRELAVAADEVSRQVSALRAMLSPADDKPFDPQASFALYRAILAPVEDMLRQTPRLSFVVNGALTSLPPQLLVTRDPAGKALKDVAWLARTHAVTILPSVQSLKVLRNKPTAGARMPLIGFGDPVFDPDSQRLQQNPRMAANVTPTRGIRGTIADIDDLKAALRPLPDTAKELKQIAASVKAAPANIILGRDATETRVKQEKLYRYRIVYFATHGLLAGDVAHFAKLNTEPALVLSLPEIPNELDDGFLTASEVAQLKLDADWVVLSACNTASGDRPGAEALSGLARAFFYAGGRSLLVSNWEVDTKTAVPLMGRTFAALAANPKLSHGEALRTSMLAMIADTHHPERADPKFWAPFVVVGEPAKRAH